MPRGGSAKDMRWFKGPERCMMHTFNAHSEGNKVILYAPFYDSNFFPFFPPVDGTPWNPAKARAFIRKITLDLDKRSDHWQEEILWPMQVGDLGKVDPRIPDAGDALPVHLVQRQRPAHGSREDGPERCSARRPTATGVSTSRPEKCRNTSLVPMHALQECSFVPRGVPGGGANEGDGYLVGVASNYAEMRSELIIADAQRLGEGDIARVILPFRISQQVHGVWANTSELPQA